MRFLVDMCVDVRVATWLREEGYDAVHLREQGLQKLPDGQIFKKAFAEQRVVITQDLDFGEIVASTTGTRTAVIVFRLRDPRYLRLIERLRILLATIQIPLQASIVIVEEGRFRIRHFPS